jgi:POT family proton-dependent oligopeptide transporter
MGRKYLGDAGRYPVPAASPAAAAQLRARTLAVSAAGLGLAALIVAGGWTGVWAISPTAVADAAGYALLFVTVGFFGWLFLGGDWTPEERRRLYAVAVLFVAAALFWSSFEQAGSTLNLFADRATDTTLHGLDFPSSYFQSLNALYIIALAPVFAWLWVWLGPAEPSSAVKFALGLIQVGAGFAVLVVAAQLAEQGVMVSPMWLAVTYLLHTTGELCLSPVGLSAMTKLAPARIVGLMMGVWFLAASVGNYIGGRLSAFYETLPLPHLFGAVGSFGIAAGLVLWVLARPLQRLMGGVK